MAVGETVWWAKHLYGGLARSVERATPGPCEIAAHRLHLARLLRARVVELHCVDQSRVLNSNNSTDCSMTPPEPAAEAFLSTCPLNLSSSFFSVLVVKTRSMPRKDGKKALAKRLITLVGNTKLKDEAQAIRAKFALAKTPAARSASVTSMLDLEKEHKEEFEGDFEEVLDRECKLVQQSPSAFQGADELLDRCNSRKHDDELEIERLEKQIQANIAQRMPDGVGDYKVWFETGDDCEQLLIEEGFEVHTNQSDGYRDFVNLSRKERAFMVFTSQVCIGKTGEIEIFGDDKAGEKMFKRLQALHKMNYYSKPLRMKPCRGKTIIYVRLELLYDINDVSSNPKKKRELRSLLVKCLQEVRAKYNVDSFASFYVTSETNELRVGRGAVREYDDAFDWWENTSKSDMNKQKLEHLKRIVQQLDAESQTVRSRSRREKMTHNEHHGS